MKKIAQTLARLSQSRLTRTAPTLATSKTKTVQPVNHAAFHGLVTTVTTNPAIIASMMMLMNVQLVSAHVNKVMIIIYLSTIARGTMKRHAPK